MEPEDAIHSLNSLQPGEPENREPSLMTLENGMPESRQVPLALSEPHPESRFDSNYRYVLVAARRARQLQSGVQPLMATRSRKACRIAQDEIDAGLVRYVRRPGSTVSRSPGSLMNTYSA